MKRAFGKFVLKTVLACFILTVTAYIFFAALIGNGVQESYSDVAKVLLAVSATVSAFCITLGGLPFFLSLSEQGVKILPWSRRVKWSEVRSVKWTGLSRSRQLDRLIVEDPVNTAVIPLYIFEDPEAVVAELQDYLPWVGTLERNALPAMARSSRPDD